jgi:uncharacterized phage protein (TIGR01671 family)
MQNRLRFRAWDHEKESAVEEGNILIGMNIQILVEGEGWITITANNADRFTIRQCTGLKDKNGKLIYEGNIIESLPGGFGSGRRRVDVVKWDDGVDSGEGYEKAEFSPLNYAWFTLRTCEVIGNIYENPELLTKEK